MKIFLILTLLFALLILIVGYSWRMGKLIDPKKSNSYYNKNGTLYFSRNGNWFSLGYHKITADAKSFTVLSETIGKDKHSVFSDGKIQKQVDYATFDVVNHVVKDKDHVYEIADFGALQPLQIEGLDVASFEYLGEIKQGSYGWTRDKNQHYFFGQVVEADYESLKFLSKDFFYDKNALYSILERRTEWVTSIEHPPKELTEKYLLSGKSIYYVGTNEQFEAALKTIKYDGQQEDIKIIAKNVIGVNNQVISYGVPVNDADANSFEVVEDGGHISNLRFYKDKQHVYLGDKIITKANPKAFSVIGFGYSKDDQHVYYMTEILEGADAKSFRNEKDQHYTWIDDKGNRFNMKGERKIK